ncbi:MAG: primosomal protein N', partial [Prolixibacteraceae bacterium]|nr:primosomal protein N' [Prolixibacteraceae bacterium]
LFMWLLNELHFYAPQQRSSIPKKELLANSKASESVLKGLTDKGYVELTEIETDRLPDAQSSSLQKPLNPSQETALNEIYDQFRSKKVVLLHGVTASGKTELYIRLISEQLKAGKQVLYLLPEIALTSQIIDRLTQVFGNRAGVYHSKFNDSERVEIWNKVLAFQQGESHKYQLILGARSALFLPYQHLGLIIVDEEHENSFKQFDPAPRYHARDAAVMLGHLHQARVLLGSATPSFESYFNAKAGKYGLVRLTQKHYKVAAPEVLVADLSDAWKRKQMKAYMTPLLFEALENALQQNEQVILFQNRRGFAPFIQCRSCGWIPKCLHCDVSLTYHKFSNRLLCHYCGYSAQLPTHCTACGSDDVQSKGFGTQKVEDELKIYFPEVKIDRLDVDTTRTRQAYEKIIHRFTEGKTQILVGTQMVTKGLDFERVSVVGILNADNLMNFPDFRSYERAFQLMLQVSGRAGRKNKQGKVVIQTSQPAHPLIRLVGEGNFEQMFSQSIRERKLFRYPPWYRLINLTIKHKNRDRAQLAAQQLAQELRKTFQNNVLGPEFHLIGKMQQLYQLVIRVKLEKTMPPDAAKIQLMQAIDKVKNQDYNRTVLFIPDVDPY